ncbi:MAG: DsbA family oxidoreductase [Alphaproteobacteria bacterium]|nr:MAG: DsbA family oxidoreductase [Alphaproteobacteria bacterium]
MVNVLTLDIVSDVICPWCWIGKRRLERALADEAEAAARLDIRWRPWQLAPGLPAEGIDRRAYYARKFPDPEQRRRIEERLLDEGRSVGITFAFEWIERVPDTFDAHRLIRWAASAGCQPAVVEALFAAYFTHGRNLGSRKVLLEVAAECGMDAELVARLFAEDRDRDLVTREIAAATEMGISGVPTFIFAGRYALQGAQPSATFRDILHRIEGTGMMAG